MQTITKQNGVKFDIYPFEYDGYTFYSRVLVGSDIHTSVTNVPEEVFIQMNQDCLAELLGTGLPLDKIKERLYEINKYASSAYIELAHS
jgi:hypothetical protein